MAQDLKEEQINNDSEADISDSEQDKADKKKKKKEKRKKKDKKIKKAKKAKKAKSKKAKVLGFIIPVIVIGGLGTGIYLNLWGVRDNYIFPLLQKVPVVKNVIPQPETEPKDEYSGLSKSELVQMNKTLTEEKEKMEENNTELNNKIKELDTEVTRLRDIESQQEQFKADKEEFDRMIAENDMDAYKKFYESISPENAETLYKEAVQENEADKKLQEYVQTFENMKKDAAASMLEEMIGTDDMDLVVRILDNISTEKRAEILATMKTENAAACAKRLAPEQQ